MAYSNRTSKNSYSPRNTRSQTIKKSSKTLVTVQKTPVELPTTPKNATTQSKESNKFSATSNALQRALSGALNENEKLKANIKSILNEFEKTKKTLNELSVLQSDFWLWDDHIQLYIDIVNSRIVTSHAKLHILNPSIAQAVKINGPEETIHLLDPLNLKDIDLLIVPVNDSQELTIDHGTPLGSHWSLLCFVRESSSYYYYDSLNPYNLKHSEMMANKLSCYFGTSSDPILKCIRGPKQKNGHDCALFFIMAAEYIMQNRSDEKIFENEFPKFDSNDCAQKRASMAFVIKNRYTIETSIIKNMMYHYEKEGTAHSENRVSPTISRIESLKPLHAESFGTNKGSDNNKQQKRLADAAVQTDTSTSFTKNRQYSDLLVNRNTIDYMHKNIKQIKNQIQTEQNSRFPNNLVDLKAAHSEKLKLKKTDSKIVIVSDSHGRGLSEIINNHCAQNVEVCGLVNPGATSPKVFSTLNPKLYSSKDFVILIGGSNNVCSKTLASNFSDNLSSNLNRLKNTNVILCTLPYRYDLTVDDDIHEEVLTMNIHITNLATRHEHVKILDLYSISRHCHTKQGQHFNKRGKVAIANRILETICNIESSAGRQSCKSKVPTTASNSANTYVLGDNFVIAEAHMREVLERFSNSKDVAFSHAISADLDEAKNMSKGVALVFKEVFGKPDINDFCDQHLTCQNSGLGPLVYGLITKPKFWHKPRPYEYNNAFKELTNDFKKKGLTQLICSPMGCIRDLVPINHFAKQIVDFQKATGAGINIVVFNEKPNGVLKNGLTYLEFLNQLRHAITSQIMLAKQHKTSNTSTRGESVLEVSGTPEKTPVACHNTETYPAQTLREDNPDNIHSGGILTPSSTPLYSLFSATPLQSPFHGWSTPEVKVSELELVCVGDCLEGEASYAETVRERGDVSHTVSTESSSSSDNLKQMTHDQTTSPTTDVILTFPSPQTELHKPSQPSSTKYGEVIKSSPVPKGLKQSSEVIFVDDGSALITDLN